MKKNLFLRLCLMMAVVLSLYSCRQDYFPEKETYNNSNAFKLTTRKISLSESKHKEKLISEIEKIKAEFKIKSQKVTYGKTFSNGVSIDTDHVIYIENGPNYHTYTFNIIGNDTSTNAPVENLVLTPLPNGTYKGLFFSYNFTQQEKQNILNNIPVDTKGKTTINDSGIITTLSKADYCHYVEETIWQDCSEHVHNQNNISDWVNCTASEGPQVYTIGYWSCSSGGGSGGGSGSGGGGSGGGNGDGTGGGSGGSNNCIVEAFPNPLDPEVSNPCPIGVPTQPNLGNNNSESPCEKITELFANEKFKAKYDTLTKPELFDQMQEKAFIMRHPPIGTTGVEPAFISIDMPPCSTGDDDAVWPTTFDGITIIMHDHNNADCNGNIPIKAPSPVDIRTLLNKLLSQANTYTGSYLGATSLTTTSGGNYMLMYEGTNYPGSINANQLEVLDEEYLDVFKKLYVRNDNVTQSDIERVFTKFLKEKINKPGLNVYRVTPTSAEKLEYDSSSPNFVKETPCP